MSNMQQTSASSAVVKAGRVASLSLDLDNKWSYMKTHGDEGWQTFPSYLDVVIPRFLDFFERNNQKITVFIVGQDADLEKNHAALSSITQRGHEVGNHSFHHEPWLHLYTDAQIEEELSRAHNTIKQVTGADCVGFRGPGYSLSPAVLSVLIAKGYQYDASTFPTFIGPLARAYYFMTTSLSDEQKQERKQLFGSWRDGLNPLKPYMHRQASGQIVELPVSTMPIFKLPYHLSYLLYLSRYSRSLAMTYFRMALLLCRMTRTEPSFLLHPLDFLGKDDGVGLDFFPAMQMSAEQKMSLVSSVYSKLSDRYQVVPTGEHVSIIQRRLETR